jgi:hypothetical protein
MFAVPPPQAEEDIYRPMPEALRFSQERFRDRKKAFVREVAAAAD